MRREWTQVSTFRADQPTWAPRSPAACVYWQGKSWHQDERGVWWPQEPVASDPMGEASVREMDVQVTVETSVFKS
jgi:hypothetical protein